MKIQSTSKGATSTSIKESCDCVVRSMANASGMPYDEAHAIAKKYGRKNRKGATIFTMIAAYKEAGFKVRSTHGTSAISSYTSRVTGAGRESGVTLGKLLPTLSKGKYIVNVTGHALAVVDGKIIDTFDNSAKKRVHVVFEEV